MVLRPAWNVHTAFMRFPIDVVFLDSDQVVIRIERAVAPWRTVSCRGAREVVELAAGECERRGLEVGDRSPGRRGRRPSSAPSAARPGTTRRRRHALPSSSRAVTRASSSWRASCSRDAISRSQELTTPEQLPDAIVEPDIDLVVLDGGSAVADALRTANAARVRRPDLPVAIAADAGGRSPTGLRVFDRWNETEELLLDIERHARRAGRPDRPGGDGLRDVTDGV